jgi:hypothetical protein
MVVGIAVSSGGLEFLDGLHDICDQRSLFAYEIGVRRWRDA